MIQLLSVYSMIQLLSVYLDPMEPLQILKVSPFFHPPLFKHIDLLTVHYSLHPMRNSHSDSFLTYFAKCCLDVSLVSPIQG